MTKTNEKPRKSKAPSIPSFHLIDGFILSEFSSGVQYNLHLSAHTRGQYQSVEYFANVFLPYQGAGMATYQKITNLAQPTVHVIIYTRATSNLEHFLQMYQDVCIAKNRIKTHLHVSMLAANPRAREQVSYLTTHYPRELITLHDWSELGLSIQDGYGHVINTLPDDDIVILMDYKLLFTEAFLAHALLNAVMGRQVYMPIFFSFYSPKFVSEYLHKTPITDISADTGFFLSYSYQVVVLYKSDYYQTMRRTAADNVKGEIGKGNNRLVDKLISSDLYVMRALEPHLRREYQAKVCSFLSGLQYKLCEKLRADTIGNKQMFASLLMDNDLLDI